MTSMRPLSLRARTILSFGLLSFVVTSILAISTYVSVRGYLLQQRYDTVERRAAIDARAVSARLASSGSVVSDVIAGLDPLAASAVLIRRGGEWFSSSLDVGAADVPVALTRLVEAGTPGLQPTDLGSGPVAVVGVPLPEVGAELYEVAPLDELAGSLQALATVMTAGVVLVTAGGVLIAVWFSRRLLVPLTDVATAAAEIATGDVSRRLAPTDDPDLVTIVGSFNSMVDALQGRIERDARFAADVSHELRTPLTALSAAVDVLDGRRDEFSDRQREALALVVLQIARFRHLMDDLIELARAEVGTPGEVALIDLPDMLRHILDASGRTAIPLIGDSTAWVEADDRRLERVFLNLLDNADRHGGGVRQVALRTDAEAVRVSVDDDGPGVPAPDRERVFARFATGLAGRGAEPGTGLGLAIVRESVLAAGGEVWATSAPDGGARFVVRLPVVAKK